MRMLKIAFFLLCALFAAVVVAQRGSSSLLEPLNISPECSGFGDDVNPRGKGSLLQPASSDPCEECCSRCYIASYEATVKTGSCSNQGFCTQNGSPCDVLVFLRTNPCTDCCDSDDEFEHNLHEECIHGRRKTFHNLTSSCEIASYDVCVGPDHFYLDPFFECEPEPSSHYHMFAKEHHCENVEVDSHCGSNKISSLKFVFDDYAGHTSWPDTCFWEKHFRAETETYCPCNESLFKAWCPSYPQTLWLEAPITAQLIPITCKKMEKIRDATCHVCPQQQQV